MAIAILGSCAAVRRVKEKQATSAEAQIAAPQESVHQAALAVLPHLDLIATSDYVAGGFIEAHGDWGTAHEGTIVQISSRADGATTRVVVEAGRSARLSKAEMRALARSILERIQALLTGRASPDP